MPEYWESADIGRNPVDKGLPEKFPKQIPVFPLPNAILFPYVDLPLYIFEPRYREMLQHLLEGDRMLCVQLVKEGWEMKKEPFPACDIAGVGMVKYAVKNPDGTSNILVRGLARARIGKYLKDHPYRVAEIEILKEKGDSSSATLALTEKVKELFIRKVSLKKIISEEEKAGIQNLEDAGRLCDIIAFFSSASSAEKQQVLEILNVKERLKKVLTLLQEEIKTLESKN